MNASKQQPSENGDDKPLVDAKAMFESKNYESVTAKKEPRTMKDIEDQLWKNNIKQGPRKRVDYLNISNEDFSKYKVKGFDGKEVTPSTFNIFRDSLSLTKQKMH